MTGHRQPERTSLRYRIDKDIAYRTVADKVVIVVPRENRLITLNGTASEVWNRLDGKEIRELVVELETIFDVSTETLSQDIGSFVDQLVERRLVVPVLSGDEP